MSAARSWPLLGDRRQKSGAKCQAPKVVRWKSCATVSGMRVCAYHCCVVVAVQRVSFPAWVTLARMWHCTIADKYFSRKAKKKQRLCQRKSYRVASYRSRVTLVCRLAALESRWHGSLTRVVDMSPCQESLIEIVSCRVCHVLSCHVVPCHVMSCHVMSCHVVSCRVVSCHVMSCHVMSCHVM